MTLIRGFEALPALQAPVVTLGSYDGVDLGHRALIDALVGEAQRIGGESVVVTFEPHPRIALGDSEALQLLTPLEEKAALLTQMGVDYLLVIPFDKAFSVLSGEEFIQCWLVERLGLHTLVMGYNHRLGHNHLGATEIEALGVRVIKVEECSLAGAHISSTAIRRLIAQGRMREAEALLGHPIALTRKK